VKSVLEDAVVLQNGCVCCTLKTDLRQGIADMIDGRSEGKFPDFDRIVLETTGLADPAPIAQTLLIDPMLRNQVRLANVVATVDGVLGAEQLQTHAESMRQAAVADRLVLTKTDMVSPAAAQALRGELARLNPTARVYDIHADKFDARALLTEGVTDSATKLAEVRHWLEASGPEHDHNHEDTEEPHLHLGGQHSERITSFSLRVEEEVDWTAFGVWLTVLLHRHGPKVLRVKGLLRVLGATGPVVLHGVQHVIHPPIHLDEWPDADHASRIVFVVQGIDPALLRRSLTTFLGAASGGRKLSRETVLG
jgi:G3E family GTPase